MILPKTIGRKRGLSGYTFVELMMTITITGILVVIVIPRYVDSLRESGEGETKARLGIIRNAVTTFDKDNGIYPLALTDLTINGKYLKAMPELRLPYYHWATTSNRTFDCPDTPCDAIGISAAIGESRRSHPSWTLGVTAPPPSDNSNAGNVWIACTHTDTRGTSWMSY